MFTQLSSLFMQTIKEIVNSLVIDWPGLQATFEISEFSLIAKYSGHKKKRKIKVTITIFHILCNSILSLLSSGPRFSSSILIIRKKPTLSNTRAKRLRMRKVSIFKISVANTNFTTKTPFFELKSNFISIQNFKAGNVKPPGMHWSKDF